MTSTAAIDSTTTTQVFRVYIKAAPQAIWDAITKPEWTVRYGYGARSVFELRPGGKFSAYATDELRAIGAPEVPIDGEVLEVDPPRKLVQTWRMRFVHPSMEPEGFTRLTYEIAAMPGGVSRLTVTHDLTGAPGLALLVSGRLEDTGAGGGWSWILSDLKTLLESGVQMTPRGSDR
jgi:uncharacterized protein YndB with AHSA1/START domain